MNSIINYFVFFLNAFFSRVVIELFLLGGLYSLIEECHNDQSVYFH